MSTKFEKVVARHELIRRKVLGIEKHIEAIESLPTDRLGEILLEPDEDENPDLLSKETAV